MINSAVYTTETLENNLNYNLVIINKNDHVEYGDNIFLTVSVKDNNNEKATNGKVRMYRDAILVAESDVLDGEATLTYDTTGKIITAFNRQYSGLGQYVSIIYTSSDNKSTSIMDYLIIYKKNLEFN
ncbi:UNVERIFIED_CONTAM: hypothetical protein O8I53_11640 [Campylobacter lari]